MGSKAFQYTSTDYTDYQIFYNATDDTYALYYQPSYGGALPVVMRDDFNEIADAWAYAEWLETGC